MSWKMSLLSLNFNECSVRISAPYFSVHCSAPYFTWCSKNLVLYMLSVKGLMWTLPFSVYLVQYGLPMFCHLFTQCSQKLPVLYTHRFN